MEALNISLNINVMNRFRIIQGFTRNITPNRPQGSRLSEATQNNDFDDQFLILI